MAFDIGNTLHAIETYVQKLGLFQSVAVGEPKSPRGRGFMRPFGCKALL